MAMKKATEKPAPVPVAKMAKTQIIMGMSEKLGTEPK